MYAPSLYMFLITYYTHVFPLNGQNQDQKLRVIIDSGLVRYARSGHYDSYEVEYNLSWLAVSTNITQQ